VVALAVDALAISVDLTAKLSFVGSKMQQVTPLLFFPSALVRCAALWHNSPVTPKHRGHLCGLSAAIWCELSYVSAVSFEFFFFVL
jgi:hypothetical protein